MALQVKLSVREVQKFKLVRENTIKQLRKIGNEIREHGKNAKIASAVGSGVSVVSGVGSVIAFALTPVTFGVSAIVGAALAGVSAAGAATSLGSSLVNQLIEKGLLQDCDRALEADRNITHHLEYDFGVGDVLARVLLPLNVGVFIKNAIDLANGDVSMAGDNVLALARKLEDATLTFVREFNLELNVE